MRTLNKRDEDSVADFEKRRSERGLKKREKRVVVQPDGHVKIISVKRPPDAK